MMPFATERFASFAFQLGGRDGSEFLPRSRYRYVFIREPEQFAGVIKPGLLDDQSQVAFPNAVVRELVVNVLVCVRSLGKEHNSAHLFVEAMDDVELRGSGGREQR